MYAHPLRRTGLSGANLDDVLTPDLLRNVPQHNTEHLVSLFVVVPTGGVEEFLATYETVGTDIAFFGNPDWTDPRNASTLGQRDHRCGPEANRQSEKGSPVVPGSAVYVIYYIFISISVNAQARMCR